MSTCSDIQQQRNLQPLSPEKDQLTLGYVPLTDSAPLIIAKEKGFFDHQGLQVSLSREMSWASIRDKVTFGVLDAACMLAPMPLASSMGLSGSTVPMITAMSIDLNGNAITLSSTLAEKMIDIDPSLKDQHPWPAHALKSIIDQRKAEGLPKLTMGVVFPFSTHNYELRYWMAASGIHADYDVELKVVPPPLMVEQMASGQIDAFCVGEPWNSLAVQSGIGRVAITKHDLWNNGPEKVLGVTAAWAENHPHTHLLLIEALLKSCAWLDVEEHRNEAVEILSRAEYLDTDPAVIAKSMTGSFQYDLDHSPLPQPDFNVFSRYAANYPWRSHALWFIGQMIRWAQLDRPVNPYRIAEQVYRPDIFRQAANRIGITSPTTDYKTEGSNATHWTYDQSLKPIQMGPDLRFDQYQFDPYDISAYLGAFHVHSMQTHPGELILVS